MNRMTHSLLPDFRAATFSPEELTFLAAILKRYGVEKVKFTTGGRLRLTGIDRESLASIAAELRTIDQPSLPDWITSLQSCPGRGECRYGHGDGGSLAARIMALEPPCPPPAKIKIGIAGCARCCTEPYLRDIGLVAGANGCKLIFGGNGGGRPRIGDLIARGLSEDEAVALVARCLRVYGENAAPGKRTARFMESFGAEAFRRAVFSIGPVTFCDTDNIL